MAVRQGKETILLESKPEILSNAAVVGKKEGDGPLGKYFDEVFFDGTLGLDSWEKAESRFLQLAAEKAIAKANLRASQIQAIFSGDLLNQCTGSSFGIRGLSIPFAGLFSACSTMALGLIFASMSMETGAFEYTAAATCSHFCSAEKQFRLPLEYGGQRTPTAQWTVTGAGAAILGKRQHEANPYIDAVHIGRIVDYGITDANNMGAAMAPAACDTICGFLRNTNTTPQDYDMILTGDLGSVGSELLCQLTEKEYGIDIKSVHRDCGLMIFDREKQDVHAGGSGCGCSASVLCSYILNSMRKNKFKKILFAATGALMSPVSSLQGESIPGISHAVRIIKD